jgi:hypothetical protein
MPIKLACLSCDTKLSVKDELAGRSIKCPKCSTITRVPGGSAPAPTATRAAAPGKTAAPAKTAASARTAGSGTSARASSAVSKAPAKAKAAALPEEALEEVDSRGRSIRKDPDLQVDYEVPEKYKQRIEDELSKGERLIWCGQPSRRIVVIRSLIYTAIGAIVALSALVFALVNMMGRGAHVGNALMGGFIGVMVGIPLMLTPLWRLWKAGRTCYVLTSRRCIVWRCEWYGGVTMDNYSPAQLTNMFRRDMWLFGNGGGDVVFRTLTIITTTHYRRGGTSTSMQTYLYGFLAVENVRDIERLVRETLVDKLVDKLTE